MPLVVATIDDFDRPDAPNLGPNWTPAEAWHVQRLAIQNNGAICPGGVTVLDEFWNREMFGPDVEFTATFARALGLSEGFRVYARVASAYPGVPVADWPYPWEMLEQPAYQVGAQGNTISLVLRSAAGNPTTLETGYSAYLPVGIGIRCVGSTISALARPSADSPWEVVTSATDTTVPGAGYVMMGIIEGAGGGIIETSGGGDDPTNPPPAPLPVIDFDGLWWVAVTPETTAAPNQVQVTAATTPVISLDKIRFHATATSES